MKEALTVSVFCALTLVTATPSVAEPVQLGGRYLDFITVAGDSIAGWVVEENNKEEEQGRENIWTTRSRSQKLPDRDEAASTTIAASPAIDTTLFKINGLEEAKPSKTTSITPAASTTALQKGINAEIKNNISLTVDDANMNAFSNLSKAPASLSVDTGTVASVDTGTVASSTASALAVNKNGGGATSAHRTSSSQSIKNSEGGRATANAASMSMSSSSLFTARNAAIRFTSAAPTLRRSGGFAGR
jgi:hypothetical protein